MKCEYITETTTMTQFPWSSPLAGPNPVAVRCRTHNFMWPGGGPPVTNATQCPIGQIEDATEKALAQIAEAKAK